MLAVPVLIIAHQHTSQVSPLSASDSGQAATRRHRPFPHYRPHVGHHQPSRPPTRKTKGNQPLKPQRRYCSPSSSSSRLPLSNPSKVPTNASSTSASVHLSDAAIISGVTRQEEGAAPLPKTLSPLCLKWSDSAGRQAFGRLQALSGTFRIAAWCA